MSLPYSNDTSQLTTVSVNPAINPFDAIEYEGLNHLKSTNKGTATFSVITGKTPLYKNSATEVLKRYSELSQKENWDFGSLTSTNYKLFLDL